jgi:Terminase large subunit, T4likevirus-type, N-terminal
MLSSTTVAKRPSRKEIYLNNPKLKRVGIPVPVTQEQIDEYIKCRADPIYFAQKYVKIVTIDKGFVPISLYPFQEQTIMDIVDNRFVIIKAGRQVGKTTTIVAYILWYVLFQEDKFVAILANKAKTSREILTRIKLAYEELPQWLQQGVAAWNKGDIELENKCRILADSTSGSAARGYTINLLYLDEFAFVPNTVADEFFTSVFPTISSGETSKILISSTPNGMNHFYRIWKEAEEGVNGFKFIEANWRQVPGRTQKWADDQKRVLGEQKFLQEMECVTGNTKITVRNKITGLIETLSIEEIYNRI